MTRRSRDAAGRTTCRCRRAARRTTSQPADRRAAGAEAVRAGAVRCKPSAEGDRGVAARRRRRVRRVAHRSARTAGRSAERDADGAERRVPLRPRHIAILFRRFVSFGDDVTRAVRRRDRGARHSAPARRRQGVPRPRGSRDDSRGARGHRVARRRAVGVCDAARARSSRSTTSTCSSSGIASARFIRSGFRRSSAAIPGRSSR